VEQRGTNVNPIALLKKASASSVKPCFSLPMIAEIKSSLPSCLSMQLNKCQNTASSRIRGTHSRSFFDGTSFDSCEGIGIAEIRLLAVSSAGATPGSTSMKLKASTIGIDPLPNCFRCSYVALG
jgi:hypothetical protein